MKKIKIYEAKSLSSIFEYIENINLKANKTILAFRGEKEDYGDTALCPFIYRNNYIKNEDKIYRESQRFNDRDFDSDLTTFDKLSRIQHYFAPTRLLDISEDIMSSLYFATEKSNESKKDAILYIFEIKEKKIRYYDSDTVSVISNLVKIPLTNKKSKKSKTQILQDINKKNFNKQESIKFLLHEIKEEKHYFAPKIKAKHITSIQCVRPKFTSNRIRSQKGFFLLFGLNKDDVTKHIKILQCGGKVLNTSIDHPIKQIHKIILKGDKIDKIKNDLSKIGITRPFIYPEIDKVSEFLQTKYYK